jgi:Ca2+-binding RTX toxin-like protein
MKTKPKPHITTTPTFWSNEVTLTSDPLAVGAHVTAVTGDNVMVGWSSGTDMFGFQLNPQGSFVTGNLLADVSNSLIVPLSTPQFVQQSDGSLIAEYNETVPILGNPENDVMWHIVNSGNPANATPIAGSGQSETFQDATATSGTATSQAGSAVVFETFQGGRFFQNLQFVNANGTKSVGVILIQEAVPSATQSQLDPTIAGLANGNVALAYQSFTPGANGAPDERDIRLHIYTPAGGDVAQGVFGSHEVSVSDTGLNAILPDMVITNGGTPGDPADDQIVIAWEDNNGIEFRRFTNERGIPLDQAPHTIAGSGNGIVPHVAALNDGGFIVEWGQSFGQESDGSGDFGLVLQRFDKDGNAVGNQVIIDNPGDQGAFSASLATLQDGRVIMTFNNETGDATDLTTLDYVILDPRNQTINGTGEADTIVGRQDASTINGLDGADRLTGMNANDALNGGAGSDTLTGGLGKDLLIGGADADNFDFNSIRESKGRAPDVIKDFHHAQGDKIDVSDIDANTKVDGLQGFHFIGGKSFHHKAGELHFVSDHHRGVFVEGDVNGDGRADFRLDVQHVSHLGAGDFFLIQT